jgi:hypothetical protein
MDGVRTNDRLHNWGHIALLAFDLGCRRIPVSDGTKGFNLVLPHDSVPIAHVPVSLHCRSQAERAGRTVSRHNLGTYPWTVG